MQQKTTASETLFKMMNFVFKTVITNDERINLKEVNQEELTEFIESMDSKQFSKVKDFIESVEKKPNFIFNKLLFFIFNLESKIINNFNFPFGISILGIFEKR